MSKDTIIEFITREEQRTDSLTDLLRTGAQQLIAITKASITTTKDSNVIIGALAFEKMSLMGTRFLLFWPR